MRLLLLGLVIISFQVEAKTYSICSESYEKARLDLASMIHSSISNVHSKEIISKRKNDNENVFSTIAQSSKVESHLDLVEVELSSKDKQKCAAIESDKQIEHTKALLTKSKSFTLANLPDDNEKKVKILEKWLDDITKTQQMINVFGKDISAKDELELAARYKKLSDLHSETLLKIDTLVFKGCATKRSKALRVLDQEIFTVNKSREKGFFDSFKSLFSKNDVEMKVMLFEPYVEYHNKGKKECAFIEKSKLLRLTTTMRHKLDGFQTNTLPKEPKESMKKLENWLSHVEITYTLMEVFKNEFNTTQLNNVTSLKIKLNNELKNLLPQSILFHAAGSSDVKVVLNGRTVDLNKKMYVPEGVYTYVASSPGYCQIKASITLDRLEDEEVNIDFNKQEYPTVLFVSDIDFTAMVDGISVKPNVRTTIKRCNKEVPYLVNSASQSYQGTLDLDPGDSITKNFNFLNKQELATFSNAKTKHFEVKNDEKFSDTLTNFNSKKLAFIVKNSPTSGNLVLDKSGHFVYEPKPEFTGKDSFEYIIDNGNEKSPPRVVIIDVTGNAEKVIATPVAEEKPKSVIEENTENVDQAKFEAYLNQKFKEKDIATLKAAQQHFPKAFEIWMKKARGM